jgi:hypothetical protein
VTHSLRKTLQLVSNFIDWKYPPTIYFEEFDEEKYIFLSKKMGGRKISIPLPLLLGSVSFHQM